MANPSTPLPRKKPSYIPRQQLTASLGIIEKELDEIMEMVRQELRKFDLRVGLNSTRGKAFKAQLIPLLQSRFPETFGKEQGLEAHQSSWYEYVNAILISEKNKMLKVQRNSSVATARRSRSTSASSFQSREHSPTAVQSRDTKAPVPTIRDECRQVCDIHLTCLEVLDSKQDSITMGRLKDIMESPRSDLDAVTWQRTLEWLCKETGFEESRHCIFYRDNDGHKIPVRGDSTMRATLQYQLNQRTVLEGCAAMKFVYHMEALASHDSLSMEFRTSAAKGAMEGPEPAGPFGIVATDRLHTSTFGEALGVRRNTRGAKTSYRTGPYHRSTSRVTQSCP